MWWFYIIFGVIAGVAISIAGLLLVRARGGGVTTADRIAASATVVATLVAGATLFYADRNERRLEWDRTHQYANKVYIGEAPQYYYEKYPRKEGDPITRVVINASGIEVRDVWVEGRNEGGTGGDGIKIEGIQRCTMYSVPLTTKDEEPLDPKAVHFTEPYAEEGSFNWRRTIEGRLDRGGSDIPEEVTFGPEGGSNAMDVQDCSG